MGKTILLMTVIILTCILGSLSQTALNAMLITISRDFSIEVGMAQVVTTIYMLVVGITVPVVSYLMRKYSVKGLLITTIVLFFAGAVLDVVAPDFLIFVAGRVLQAISTGIITPLMMSVAMMRFPAGKQATVMGIAGIAMGFAPNIGPTLGGWFIEVWNWRGFFIVLVICTIVLLLISLISIERELSIDEGAHLDILSVALSALGFGGVLLGVTNISSFSMVHPLVLLPLILGIIFLVAFLLRQRHCVHPLIHLEIFDSQRFVVGFWSGNFLFLSFIAITLILPLYVEGYRGFTAFEAGLTLLPGTIAALIFNPVAGILTDRSGARPVMIAGSVCLTLGAISMIFVGNDTPLWELMLMQGVRACGVSLLMAPLNAWSLKDLPGPLVVDGSSFSTACRQCCASIGTALMVFATTLAPVLPEALMAYQLAFGISAFFAVIMFVINIVGARD